MKAILILLTLLYSVACWKRNKATNWFTLEEGIISPEGIETGDNKIYITTNGANGGGLIVVNSERVVVARYSFPNTTFVTGIGYNPVSGDLFAGDSTGKLFRVQQSNGRVRQIQNLGEGVFPNDWIFDSVGNVYMSASAAGRIYRMDQTGANAQIWLEDDLFKAAPFGINGITWDSQGKYLYASVSSTNRIVRFPVKKVGRGEMEVDGPGAVWASNLFSPDGIYYDASTDFLWVCNNAVNQISVLNTVDGSLVQVAGDFDGVVDGQVLGLLQPASIAKWGNSFLVTNLGGDFGDVNSAFAKQITRWNVARIKAVTRGFRSSSSYSSS